MKRRVYIFVLSVLVTSSFMSCNLFTGGDVDVDDFRYIPGEIVVSLEEGYTVTDLIDLLEGLDAVLLRPLGTGYAVGVPVGEEGVWIQRLDEEKLIKTVQLNRFGYSYSVDYGENTPLIANGMLHVIVSHGGCNPGHSFTLEYERIGSSAYEIWLYKETPDQPCRAYFSYSRSFTLPEVLRNAGRIILLNPVDESMILK